jgi:hypothetical protein
MKLFMNSIFIFYYLSRVNALDSLFIVIDKPLQMCLRWDLKFVDDVIVEWVVIRKVNWHTTI